MFAKRWLMIVGIALLALGLIGAMSGGHDHVFTVFGVNFNHNAVRIVTGAIALLMAWAGARTARLGCQLSALLYGLVLLAGIFQVEAVVRWLNLNAADTLFHLVITAPSAWYGFLAQRTLAPSH